MEQQVWYEWKPMFCQKCLQVVHSYEDKPTKIIKVQMKGQEQEKMKEQMPITKEQISENIQVEDNQKEISNHEKDETPQE